MLIKISKKNICLAILFCMTFLMMQLMQINKVYAADVKLNPTDDTYVDSDGNHGSGTNIAVSDGSTTTNATVNYVGNSVVSDGSGSTVSKEAKSAIRFDLGSINATEIKSVTLRFKVAKITGDTSFMLAGSNNDNWKQSDTITIDSDLSGSVNPNNIIVNTYTNTMALNGWVEINVDELKNFISTEVNGNKVATFVLIGNNKSGDNQFAYYSQDDSVTANKPQLEVVYSVDFSKVGIDQANGKLTGTNAVMEYSLDSTGGTSGHWTKCDEGNTSITGSFLESDNVYYIYLRDPQETTSVNTPTIIRKYKTPNLSYDDYENKISDLTSAYQYRITEGTTVGAWKDGPATVGTGEFDGAKKVEIKLKAASGILESDIQTINFTANPTISLSGIDINVAQQKITGVPAPTGTTTTSAIEYSLNSTNGVDGNWTVCTYPEVTGVNFVVGNFYLRQIGNINNNNFITVTKPGKTKVGSDDKENTITGMTSDYEYRINSGSWTDGSIAIGDLSGKKTVEIRVKAIAHALASDIQTINFTTLPGVPTDLKAVAGDRQATISFTAPDDGGSIITDYTVHAADGTTLGHGSQSPITVTGLTNGVSYKFILTATNINGTSANSEPSNEVAPVSHDASLSYLNLSSGTLSPSFPTSGTNNYTATVPNSVASIKVTPTAADSNAKITINGKNVASKTESESINLTAGVINPIMVQVLAQDGTTTATYVIAITREKSDISDSSLSSLSVEGKELVPIFSADNLEYTITNVEYKVTSIKVSAVANVTTAATVTINGQVAKSTASITVGLDQGNNNINVIVKAKDGTTTNYIIRVYREAPLSSDNNLSNLVVSQGILSPTFSPSSTSYTIKVDNSIGSIAIKPTVDDSKISSVVINTQNAYPYDSLTVISGTFSDEIQLNSGANTISIVVTALDGTKKTYKITVTRGNIVHVTGVTLDTESKTLLVNDKLQLSATVAPTSADDKVVTWYSSNTSVAEVDKNGFVTTKSAGNVVITASSEDGGITANCNIEVKSITTNDVDPSKIDTSGSGSTVSYTATTSEDGTVSIPGTVMKKLKDANKGLSVTIGETTIVIPTTILNPSNYSGDPSTYSMQVSRYALGSLDIQAKLISKTTNYGVVINPFELVLNLVDSSGTITPIHNFAGSKPITVNLQLTDSDLKGRDVSKLAVYYWNPTKTQWESQGGSYNTSTKVMTFNTTHFSVFALMDSAPPVNVTGVTINTTSKTIKVGGTVQLTATLLPAKATDKTVTWTSSNPAVATVDSYGKVTGIAVGDKVTITATTDDGGFTAASYITVNSTGSSGSGSGSGTTTSVTGVTVSPTSKTIKRDSTFQLSATVTPSGASNKNTNWYSSNTAIATVDDNGKVTAVANGYVTITVYTEDSGYSATCSIIVNGTGIGTTTDDRIHVTGVTISSTSLTLNVNDTSALKATIAPAKAYDQNVLWASTNPAVATVDGAGNVTAVAGGNAIIYVTTEEYGYSASCSVLVTSVPIKGMTLSGSKTMNRGDKVQFIPKYNPANATGIGLRWESSDESVLVVNSEGNVIAVGAGSATIYATTSDGKYTAKVDVTVPVIKGTGVPKVSFVGLSNVPALAGTQQQFYLTSSDTNGDVQYQIFYISTAPDGPDRTNPLNWTKIQDWTEPHDPKSPYVYDVPPMDEGDYAFAIRVKRAGLTKGKTLYYNDAGEFDDAYPFNYNFVSEDNVGLSTAAIVPNKTQCTVGENVTINVVKGEGLYRLFTFNESLGTKWSEIGVIVNNAISWTPKKSGDYVVVVQLIDTNGDVLGWRLLKISVYR